jgi:CheY-like chemotaxis protein
VTLDLQIAPGVGGRARGDAKRITQAMTTLLANAVHFAPPGSSVDVRLEALRDAAALSVRDAGATVPPGALPFLFDRTRPRDPARASVRGDYRLGLSFVKDVATRHGGSITAESLADPEGMKFRLVLPLETASNGVVSDVAESVPIGPHLFGLRVLLVDDEPDAREALAGILQHYGAIVRAASSAADAIAVLRAQPVDVLLADIGMPGADGYDLIRDVRCLESRLVSQVPAVAVTAFTSDADRRRALEAGFQVHLSKPVDPSALVATVAALGKSSLPSAP